MHMSFIRDTKIFLNGFDSLYNAKEYKTQTLKDTEIKLKNYSYTVYTICTKNPKRKINKPLQKQKQKNIKK